jgi:NAD(P)-dependent dehydrogenase (short-subunit alcohol dehydrogenase family)
MTIVVLGGYGNVGRHVVNRLREAGEHVLTAGRDARRADLVLDARSPSGIDASLDGVDVVVNTAGIEDPALARQITRAGAAFVDITATTGYVEALERSQLFAPVLLSVGLAPGLTNLLAAELHREAPGRPIDIALLLGAGERYGKASTAWAYRLLRSARPQLQSSPAIRPARLWSPAAVPGRLQRSARPSARLGRSCAHLLWAHLTHCHCQPGRPDPNPRRSHDRSPPSPSRRPALAGHGPKRQR